MNRIIIAISILFFLFGNCELSIAGCKGFAECKKLAEQGDAQAQNYLGVLYVKGGEGVDKDQKEAFKWFKLAAEQGLAKAQGNVGLMFGLGIGVAQDHKEAVKWYKLAAEQGDAKAQYNLGLLYGTGKGVDKDPKEAVKWIKLAAEQGIPDAQYSLGVSYSIGRGVDQDQKEATKWFKLAAEQGFAKARSKLNEGRVYASLIMDTNEEYNKDALLKIKNNENKFAGFDIDYNFNQSGLFEKITLKSPTPYIDLLWGTVTGEEWPIEKINEIANKIKNKYKMIDSKQEEKKYNIDIVRNAILDYHNERKNPSQGAYNIDAKNAQAIKNLTETFVFSNKGDKIIMTVKRCIEGKKNTCSEILFNDVYSNSLTIEYISKMLVEKENKIGQEKSRKNQEKNQKESKEMDEL